MNDRQHRNGVLRPAGFCSCKQVALPDEPRTAAGLYWGYTTRIARGVGAVFSECPFEVRGQARTCRRLHCMPPAHELIPARPWAWVTFDVRGVHGVYDAVPVCIGCRSILYKLSEQTSFPCRAGTI